MTTAIKQPRLRVEILSSRLTCVGMQYRVADDYHVEVVTVTEEGLVGCTCGADNVYIACDHIGIVLQRREEYLEAGKNREIMHLFFDVTNEEMKRCIYG